MAKTRLTLESRSFGIRQREDWPPTEPTSSGTEKRDITAEFRKVPLDQQIQARSVTKLKQSKLSSDQVPKTKTTKNPPKTSSERLSERL